MFESLGTVTYKGMELFDITRFAYIMDQIEGKYTLPVWTWYTVNPGQMPEHIAYDFYGDCEATWILYLVNKIGNPFWQWLMNIQELEKMIEQKYGEENVFNPHHWVDNETGIKYATVHDNSSIVTNYEYEFNENEKRRLVKIVRPELYHEIKLLYDDLMSQKDIYSISRMR